LAAAGLLPMTFARTILSVISSVLVLLATALVVSAQSANPNFPTPVFDKNLLGHIAARDVGDARLTNHYYAFRGTPGDLVITVQNRNLNGDIDVFTLGTLRPLLKLTLYAENTAPITKSIYLRKTEDLLLRVQARSPNDEEGTYQLSFAGSFLAIEGGPNAAEAAEPTGATPTSGGGRRASSVGARINEPPPPLSDVAVVPAMPEPTPAPTPVESPKPIVTAEQPTETAPARPAPRTARNRRPTTPPTTTPRRSTTTPKPKETPVETAKTEEPTAAEPAATEPAPKPKPPARSTSRRSTTATTRPTTPKVEPKTEPKPEAAEAGPRLIIETNDGTLINQSMSRVKRVTIENGAVVVIAKDGKIDRILLANVVKMSIEPQ